MSPRWGFGAGWVALAIDMPPLWGFWVFGLDMLCDIHCAPLERRDWKDRRSIDISLLWSERHISACWGYGSGKMPDLQQGNHKGCPYKDRPNVEAGFLVRRNGTQICVPYELCRVRCSTYGYVWRLRHTEYAYY